MKRGWKSMMCFLAVLGAAVAARADVIVPYRPDPSDVRGLGLLGLLFCVQLLLSGACFLVLARKEPDWKVFGVVAALLAAASAAPWVAAGTPFWIPLGLACLVVVAVWLLVPRIAGKPEVGKRGGWLANITVVLLLLGIAGDGAYVNSELHRAAEEFNRQQRINRPHKDPYWEEDFRSVLFKDDF